MLVTLTTLALGFGAHFVLRYLGRWTENDTAVFARAIRGMIDAGRISYPDAYPHGFSYPAWGTVLSEVTGLSVGPLLQMYLPIVGAVLLAVSSFATFSRLMPSRKLAVVASALLFLVPELMFTVLRGNHEKLTITLTLVAVLALVAGSQELAKGRRWSIFAGWVAVYYAATFGLATLNTLFGSSFIVAATLAYFLHAALTRAYHTRTSKASSNLWARRLPFVTITSWTFVLLVMFFVYPRSSANLELLATTLQKLSTLLLSFTPEANPYMVTVTDWSSRTAYVFISSFRWVLFLSSFASWLVLSVGFITGKWRAPESAVVLLLLYGAFGFQVAAAIPIDFLGLGAGTNLQVRMYTYFVLFAAPLTAFGVGLLWVRLRARTVFARPFKWVAVCILAAFAGLSMVKYALEPAFSNRWLFYDPQEVAALMFWDNTQSRDAIWIGPEDRLFMSLLVTGHDVTGRGNRFITSRSLDVEPSSAVTSEIIVANRVAWRAESPTALQEQVVYDNGDAALTRRVPRTPFQR